MVLKLIGPGRGDAMSLMRAETATELAPTVAVALPAAQDMARERCDTCEHRAYVMVVTAQGPLSFCAHHFQENAIELAGVSAIIHDIRNELVPTNRFGD